MYGGSVPCEFAMKPRNYTTKPRDINYHMNVNEMMPLSGKCRYLKNIFYEHFKNFHLYIFFKFNLKSEM